MSKCKQYSILYIFLLIIICSCSEGNSSEEPVMEEQNEVATLEGRYVGTWNSNTDLDITYTDYAISAEFEFSNTSKTRLTGAFFATSSFSSCCNSGDNDGTMFLNLDGDTITSFNLNDVIPECTGTFSGSGSIISKSPYTIQIDFTGSDCDGNHIGQLLFTRMRN